MRYKVLDDCRFRWMTNQRPANQSFHQIYAHISVWLLTDGSFRGAKLLFNREWNTPFSKWVMEHWHNTVISNAIGHEADEKEKGKNLRWKWKMPQNGCWCYFRAFFPWNCNKWRRNHLTYSHWAGRIVGRISIHHSQWLYHIESNEISFGVLFEMKSFILCGRHSVFQDESTLLFFSSSGKI